MVCLFLWYQIKDVLILPHLIPEGMQIDTKKKQSKSFSLHPMIVWDRNGWTDALDALYMKSSLLPNTFTIFSSFLVWCKNNVGCTDTVPVKIYIQDFEQNLLIYIDISATDD